MAEQSTMDALAKLTGSLATIGVDVFAAQEKSRINTQRVKAGLQPCPGPADCPAIFQTDQAGVSTGGGEPPPKKDNTLLIVGALAAVVIVGFLVMRRPPPRY